MVLSYMTRMGVSSAVVEAMSETSDDPLARRQGSLGDEPRHRSRRKAVRPLFAVNPNYSPRPQVAGELSAINCRAADSLVPPTADFGYAGRGNRAFAASRDADLSRIPCRPMLDQETRP